MEVYKDGALSGKTKRMMAMVAALVHGCRACILFQTDWALKLGATSVRCRHQPGRHHMGAGETTRGVQFLEEKGLMTGEPLKP